MSKLFDKVLNFVGWEVDEDEEEIETVQEQQDTSERLQRAQFIQSPIKKSAYQSNKVVNIHPSSHMKVMVIQPEDFNDAQNICDHLKDNKPVIVNLESVEKEVARRIIDFLSGSVYSLDGTIQKVSSTIFLLAPNNVDVMGDFKDELKNKGVFPWAK